MGPKKAGVKKAGKAGAKKAGKPGAKKPGKGGKKKPVVIKTREKILGLRQKVRRRVKKPGKKKPKAEPAAKPEEAVIQLFELPPREIWPRDIVIMCLLWSYELVHKYARAFKASWLASQRYFISSRMDNDVELTTPDSTAVMMATVGAAMGVGWLADGYRMRNILKDTEEPKSKLDRKWWIMQGGFILYLVTPFVGLLLLRTGSFDLNVVLIAFQVAWYAVNPIRFWFIFHQVFPLSIFYSRIITACNLFVIGTAEYMLSMFVELRSHDTLLFVFAWTALILLMIFWMASLILILPMFNKAADDAMAVRKIYNNSEAIGNFDERQTRANYFCTTSLIYPSIMMGASREYLNFAMHQYYSPDGISSSVIKYRLHYGIGLVTVPIVTVILFFMKFIRQENRNTIVIGVAHFINLLFISCMTITIVWDIDDQLESSIVGKSQIDSGVPEAVTMIMAPTVDVGPADFTIVMPYFEGVINWPASSSIPNQLSSIATNELTTLILGRRGDEVLFAGNITFIKKKVLAYVEKEGRLILLRCSGEELAFDRVRHLTEEGRYEESIPSRIYQLTLFTSELPCGGVLEKDARGARIFVDGSCLSFKAFVRFYDMNGKLLSDHWLMPTVDRNYTVQPDSVTVPRTSLHTVNVIYIFDGREDLSFESTEVIDPSTYQRYYLVLPKQRTVEGFSLNDLEPEQNRSTLRTTPSTTKRSAIGLQSEIRESEVMPNVTCPPDSLQTSKPIPPWAWPPYSLEPPLDLAPQLDRKPHPPVEEILIFPSIFLHGLAFGALSVCYIHFLWIQSPFTFRTPILATFFALDFLGGWMVRNLIARLNRTVAYTMLAVQSFALYWHIAWAYINDWKMKPVSPDERMEHHRRF